MDITLATKSDLDIISNLARKIWPVCYGDILTSDELDNLLEKIYSRENLLYETEDLAHVFWIARVDNIPVGYISAYQEKDTVWIKKLYILSEEQGKGYGNTLMNKAISHFKDLTIISLCVHNKNLSAQNFYKKLGFKITKKLPVKMGDYDFIDFVMSKPLSK